MIDSAIKEQNERELEMLWRKKETLGKKEKQQKALLRITDTSLFKLPSPEIFISSDMEDSVARFIVHPNKIPNEIEYRIQNLEEKVKWLLEDKITTKSDEFLNVIREEFSSLQFVKEIHGIKTTSGYNLVIVHDEEKSNTVLPIIMKTKLNLKKKLPNLYLELTVLYLSDFNKKEWESRQTIFQRG